MSSIGSCMFEDSITSLTDPANTSLRPSQRRADWRFLLPNPPHGSFQHLVLLGGDAGAAEQILEVGLARRVSREIPRERSVDAMIVLCGAEVSLSDVVRCLLAGAALYFEIDRRSLTSAAFAPGRIRRSLQDVGLSPTGVYWAAPDFTNCKRYLPLDVPGALKWYLRTLYVAGTLEHRLLEIGLRLFIGSKTYRFAPLVPCYAVIAVAGPALPTAPSVLDHPGLQKELQRPGLRPVVLTSGQDRGSRAVILPFAPGDTQPTAVLKVSARADFNTSTEREQVILAEVRSELDSAMRRTIPRPLGLFRFGNLTVGVESYAPGHSLWVSSGRWRAPIHQQLDDLRLAANWLSEFNRQTQVGCLLWSDWGIHQWIEAPLAAYIRTFGVTTTEEQLFAHVRKCARDLIGASLPIVRLHHDFGPWNLYRADRKFTVIDWEFGRKWEGDCFGPALYDLLYFVTYWIHIVRRLHTEAAELRGHYDLFVAPDHRDEHTKAVHQVITEYTRTFGIDRRFLPLLLVYTWIEQALHSFARKQALGELGADARSGNRCVKYLGVLAEHVEQFFAQMGGE